MSAGNILMAGWGCDRDGSERTSFRPVDVSTAFGGLELWDLNRLLLESWNASEAEPDPGSSRFPPGTLPQPHWLLCFFPEQRLTCLPRASWFLQMPLWKACTRCAAEASRPPFINAASDPRRSLPQLCYFSSEHCTRPITDLCVLIYKLPVLLLPRPGS